MRLRTLARPRRLTLFHVASAFLISLPTQRLLGLATLGVALSVTSSAAEPDLSGLLESERNTIEVFRKAGGSVVFVTNNALRRDVLSTNISQVPQGTGSGFFWDLREPTRLILSQPSESSCEDSHTCQPRTNRKHATLTRFPTLSTVNS